MLGVTLILAASLAAAGATAESVPEFAAPTPPSTAAGSTDRSTPLTGQGPPAAPAESSAGTAVAPAPAPSRPVPRPAPSRPAAPDPRPTLEIALENQFLTEEVKLAQQPRIYLVFDISKGVVQLKARGAVFRELAVANAQSLGADFAAGPWVLSARKASSAPKRFQVEPPPLAQSPEAEAEPDSAQAQTAGQQVLADEPEEKPAKSLAEELSEKALEVTDMPSRYDLVFDKDLHVVILPKATGFGGRLSSSLSNLVFFLKLPYRFLSARRAGRQLTIIRLSMDPADARALYWSFPEGTKALFRLTPPRS